MENLFLADEIICVISIFALGFFCAILPRTRIARYFYLLFGITVLPVGIKMILDGDPWYEFIWIFLFGITAIIIGIGLFAANSAMTGEEQKEFDQNFGEMARRGGKRRMYKQFWRMKK